VRPRSAGLADAEEREGLQFSREPCRYNRQSDQP
jgi:hypothetical protein